MSVRTDLPTVPQGVSVAGGEQTDQEQDPLIGSLLDGRYRILRCLGKGGMGAVYEAEHAALARRVAVKVLQPALSRNETYRKRFLREARAASTIGSEHIVRALDFGAAEDGLLYFSMELLEGKDLEHHLRDHGRTSWDELRPIVVQILDAVGAAHARGVIHRDIKPSNCFLCDRPSDGGDGPVLVKVLDFGIAKLSAGGGNGPLIETIENLTKTNELFGTAAYMAPELVAGKPADARSDIYALGILLFRALTGKLPFTGNNALQVMQAHIAAPVPSLRDRAPELSAALESVVQRALAKSPEQRYQSVEELGDALSNAGSGVATDTGATIPARGSPFASGGSSRSQAARRSPLVIVALVLVTLAAIMVAVIGSMFVASSR